MPKLTNEAAKSKTTFQSYIRKTANVVSEIISANQLKVTFFTLKEKRRSKSLNSVLVKWCSENLQQIYRRAPTWKSDLNKIYSAVFFLFLFFVCFFQNPFIRNSFPSFARIKSFSEIIKGTPMKI